MPQKAAVSRNAPRSVFGSTFCLLIRARTAFQRLLIIVELTGSGDDPPRRAASRLAPLRVFGGRHRSGEFRVADCGRIANCQRRGRLHVFGGRQLLIAAQRTLIGTLIFFGPGDADGATTIFCFQTTVPS